MPRKPDPENVVAFTRTTAATVALKAGQRERIVWDQDLPGFGLRLRDNGSKVWVVRAGTHVTALGPTTRLNLTQAREAARTAFVSPKTKPAPSVKVETFAEVAERYLRRKAEHLTPANHKDLTRYLTHHFAALRAEPITEIRRADIARCVEKIADRSPPTAARARSQLSTFFSWMIGQGLIDINPVIGTTNPARPVRRSRVLDDAELLTIWRASGLDDYGKIVRLLILTGQRRDEVAGINWPEIYLDAEPYPIWELPETRTKNKRIHEIPLTPAVVEIFRNHPVKDGTDFLFGRDLGPYSGFSKAKERLDKIVKFTKPWTLHDLRRSTATGMANLGVLPHVVEAVLNHVSGAKAGVAGVYNHALYREEKLQALTLWSDHLLALGKPRLKVVAADAKAPLAQA